MTSIYPSSTTTASSSTSSANLLKISGMASGIDTDAVVKAMVSNYQIKIDKANQDKQTLAWQQEAYRGIITGIKGLQDYFDPLSSKYILSDNSLNINTAASDAPSMVSATSGSTAKAGTYKVNVVQLAETAKTEGDSKDSMIKVTDLSQWSNKTLNLTVVSNDVTPVTQQVPLNLSNITYGSTDPTGMSKLAAEINKQISASALNGKISASYVSDGDNSYIKFTKNSSNTDAIMLNGKSSTDGSTVAEVTSDLSINTGISSASKLSNLGITKGVSFSLSYDTTTNTTPIPITADSTTTIKQLMDKVNSATGGSVTMSIDDTTGKISFQSKNYGSTSSLKITDQIKTDGTGTTDSMIAKLGLPGVTTADVATGLTTTTITQAGTDAIVAITSPGQTKAITTTQNSNQFTVNGVSYNLVGVNALSSDTSNVTVTANSDNVITNIKSFISDYNTIISTINTKLTEKKDSAYPPLTDTQKSTMSDTQITSWETKAKVGILKNDDYLSSLMTQLRGTLYSPVYSNYNSADASTGRIALNFGSYGSGGVGIEISSEVTDGGKLVIKDEPKLKSAIENNLADFKKLFIGSSSTTLATNQSYVGSQEYNEDGIFSRMNGIMKDYVAGPGIGKDGTYTLSGYMNIFVNKQYDFSISGTSGKNTLPDQVYSKTINVSKFQTQLQDAQTRYYARFTALETAMNALNSQQSAISSMLGTTSS